MTLENFLLVSKSYSMDWRDIPSLAALRAFEATARLSSLSGAARELNVTHAAIAQHVRTLSDHFGVVLLERQGNRMVPTPDGQQLAAGLNDGFSRIAEASRTLLQTHESRPLAVTTTGNFAENWIMPRLSRFWSTHPDIPLSIKTDNAVVDLRSGGFDVAIRYGRGNWAGLESSLLVSTDFFVGAAPSYLKEHPEVLEGDYRSTLWFFDENHQEPMFWAKTAGFISDETRIQLLPTAGSLRSAVTGGAGIAVLFTALLDEELESGKLQVLEKIPQDGLGYYLVTRPGVGSQAQSKFIKWLRKEAAT